MGSSSCWVERDYWAKLDSIALGSLGHCWWFKQIVLISSLLDWHFSQIGIEWHIVSLDMEVGVAVAGILSTLWGCEKDHVSSCHPVEQFVGKPPLLLYVLNMKDLLTTVRSMYICQISFHSSVKTKTELSGFSANVGITELCHDWRSIRSRRGRRGGDGISKITTRLACNVKQFQINSSYLSMYLSLDQIISKRKMTPKRQASCVVRQVGMVIKSLRFKSW